MPNTAYYREQAGKCRRLAREMSDAAASSSLEQLAGDYERMAASLEARAGERDGSAVEVPGDS
jgi:hypothetical protein